MIKIIFRKLRVGLVAILLIPIFVWSGQQITIVAGVDNLLYESSNDSSTSNTVYPSSYNGVGVSRDKSMNEYWVWESLIWFDLQSIMGKKINKAQLILTPEVLAGDPWDAYNDTYYYVSVVAEPWNTNTVTMNNQPLVYDGWWATFNVPTSTMPIFIDVTFAIKYLADGSYANYGFSLKDGGGIHDYSYLYATFFGSKEEPGTTPPRLIVEVEGDGDAIVPAIIAPILLLD